MSPLFFNDAGRTLRFLNESLSTRRHARKLFRLPRAAVAGGTLYLYVHSHPGHRAPLRVSVNGRRHTLPPTARHFPYWGAVPIKRGVLKAGLNTIELWSDNTALDGWTLGLESNPHARSSASSLDGGRTWRNDRMGLHLNVRGEYVIRLRLADPALSDPPPPAFVWEDPRHPAFADLRAIIPASVRREPDPWQRARRLSTWACGQWTYRNSAAGTEYAPWDPLTIRAWGRTEYAQESVNPIVMCVHFGVFYSLAALAVGIPARMLCCTNALGGMHGHFISEVWMERWQKWCQVDANCDLIYVKNGVPLSVAELYPARRELPRLAVRGPGFARQIPPVIAYAERYFMNGHSFAVWAVWPRNDFFSRPELTPTVHGASAYGEPAWIWAQTPERGRPGLLGDFGMFPYHAPPGRLQAAPTGAWRHA